MWNFHHDRNHLRLQVKTAATGTYTTGQLCELVRSNQDISEGVKDVYITWTDDNSDCSDTDLEAIGNAFHDLQCLDELAVWWGWPDAKASVLLRHMPKTKIRSLRIVGDPSDLTTKFSSVMAELERGVWFASLTRFCLYHASLDELHCDSLGRLLRSRQQGKKLRIEFTLCTFPSLTGYLDVADGLIESGPFEFSWNGNTVLDATIPSYSVSSSTKPHIDFYTRYERKKDGRILYRFNEAAWDHLDQYSDLNDAGRSTVLRKENANSVQHWVNALCRDKVRDSVDYLFHFVSTNPNIYATAARLGRAEEKTPSNDNGSYGLASEQGSIAARVKRRRRR